MSKISTYEVAPVPKLADKLIGTSVGGVIEDVTYNFTLQELLTLFVPNIPQNTLQGVLDYGNTATQNINLTGTINTTTLNVGSTATILNSYLTGETHITGGLYDRLNSVGTAGQVLRSTGTKVEWYSVPTVIPNLQQVLTSGNTADIDIILDADIQALNINTNTETVFNQLILDGSLRDYNGYIGAAGQVLSSTGSAVAWVNLPVYTATSPLSIDSITKVISIQKADGTHDGYLSSLDWITFSGKQDAISLTTSGSSGPATYISNTINVPNYTLAGLGGVPQTRILTINGVSYNLSEDRTWTIPSGIGSVGATAPLSSTGGGNPVISISQADSSTDGYLSSTDWDTFNNKQDEITLTTTGTSGVATFISNTLNIPNYGGGLSGYVPYIGATGPVNLGPYNLTVNTVIVGRGTSTHPTNIAIGNSNTMGIYASTGTSNVAIGNDALAFVTTGYENTAIGNNSLLGLTQGYYNVGIGAESGGYNQLGNNNTFIGRSSGANIRNGSGNTIIGGWQGDISTSNNVVLSDGYGNLRYRYDGTNNNFYQNVNFASTLGNGTYTYTLPSATGTIALVGDLDGYVPTSRLLTINGTQYDLSANRSWIVGTVTSVAELTLGTSGTDLNSSVATGTTTPVITLNVPTASASNRGALNSEDWSTFNTKVGGVTASSPLSSSGGSTPNITIQQASGSQDGYLSSTDWTTFNNKQAAGNYITSLTGEATATGPGAASVTLDNAAVTGKVLTGVNITGGSISSTDSILTAFGKVQNQINGLIGGSIYQGTWNANTNSPTLTSGVGTRGYYYIVSVAGFTSLDGISDWNVGDWAIFDGTAWQQVDNTDAVVSVNGFTGAVSLTTDNIPEGTTNLYYLDSRARAALSFTSGSGAYNSTTGVITIPTNTNELTNGANFITLGSLSGTAPISYNSGTGAISISQSGSASDGYLSSTDWNTFNNKIAGSGTNNYVPKFTGSGSIGNSSLQEIAAGWMELGNSSVNTSELDIVGNSGAKVTFFDGYATATLQTSYNEALSLLAQVGSITTDILTYEYATNALYFRTNGNNVRLYITSSGDVAIGNVLPSYKLDVIGTGRYTGQLRLDSTITDGTYTYTLPSATGTLALTSDIPSLTGYVTIATNQTISGSKTFSSQQYFDSVLYLKEGSSGNATGYTTLGANTNQLIIGVQGASQTMAFPTISNYTYTFPNTTGTLALTSDLNSYVPTSRTLTINGVTYDLSADRSWSITAGVSSVSATSPLFSSGGSTPNLTIQPASVIQDGYLTTADWNTFNNKQSAITLTTTGTSGAATFSGGTLNIPNYTTDLSGYVPTSRTLTINGVSYDLSANRSWTITAGISSVSGTAPISVSTVSGAATVSITQATTSTDGYLSSSDWTTFNNKVPPSRTLTINGTTYDLSANRSWTISSTSASTRTVQKFTSTAGQTTFTISGGYTVGLVDVYVNGVKLDNATGVDYTATNGTTVVLTTALTANQIVEVYIYGSQFVPNNALRQVTSFTATAGQTVFTVNYSVGLVDVYYNGSCLAPSEYTATNGTSITLGIACQVNDIVVVYAYSYTVGAFSGIGGSGTTNYVSKFTSSGTIGNSLIWDNGTNVGIGNTNTTYKLDVTGTGRFTGNLGVGIGPSAWGGSDVYAIDVSLRGSLSAGGTDVSVVNNAYYNGSNWIYKETDYASYYQQLSGVHRWFVAGSGTAGGTVSFAEKMRITPSGNVGIGTTTPSSFSGYTITSISGTNGGVLDLMYNGTSQMRISAENGNNYIAGVTNAALQIWTNGSERMRITSGGNVFVNTTTASAASFSAITLQVKNEIVSTGSSAGLFWENRSGGVTSTTNWYGWYTTSGTIYLYNGSANIASVNASNGTYTALSDVNKKKDFEDSTIGLNAILGLKPTLYRMKTDSKDSNKQLGFIAQEVKEFIPQAYVETIAEKKDGGVHIGLNYNAIVAALVKSIQELKAEIDELKNK